jgi:TIR domain
MASRKGGSKAAGTGGGGDARTRGAAPTPHGQGPANSQVFVSWSGKAAEKIAAEVKSLLEIVVGVGTFYSPDDIHSGDKFTNIIDANIESCAFCVIVFTRENLTAPWIIWEASAFAAKGKRFCALLFGLDFETIPGPLKPMQGRLFVEDQVRKLCHELNAAVHGEPRALRTSHLIDGRFDGQWKTTKERVDRLLPGPAPEDDLPPTLRLLKKRWRDLQPTDAKGEHADFHVYSLGGVRVGKAADTILPDASPRERLYYLWADAQYDDWIAVEKLDDPGHSGFRVEFQTNDSDSCFPNIAIRPNGRRLLRRDPEGIANDQLVFKIRLPSIPGRTVDHGDGIDRYADGVDVSVRLVDGMKTHWQYQRNHRPVTYRCSQPGEWKTVSLSLADDPPGPGEWEPFEDDGNYHYRSKKPDFSTILAIVVSFRPLWKAHKRGNLVVMPGQAVLDVADFEIQQDICTTEHTPGETVRDDSAKS